MHVVVLLIWFGAHMNVLCIFNVNLLHFQLFSITPMVVKVHVILWSFVVLTWMCDIVGLV